MNSGSEEKVGIFKTVIPFVHYDVRKVEERHAYVENFHKRLGRFLTFVPFILVAAVACSNMTAAIWSAFVVSTLIVLLNFYRASYVAQKDKIMILDFCMWLAFLGQGIAFEIVQDRYPCRLVSPVNVTVILAAAIISIIIQYPFTIQFAKERVNPDIAALPAFKTINFYLTGFWTLLFIIMATLSWVSYAVLDDNGVAHIILAVVLPILIPIIGGVVTPYLADYLKSKRKTPNQNDSEVQQPLLADQ